MGTVLEMKDFLINKGEYRKTRSLKLADFMRIRNCIILVCYEIVEIFDLLLNYKLSFKIFKIKNYFTSSIV